ncbi:BlaI/MecI/CopY family transcriptional regulator [Verrucomicrobiales bacterium]|nr:BlaI/MecI/CopY family transcriptional regulator [Verrucomicrobiales bacterium]
MPLPRKTKDSSLAPNEWKALQIVWELQSCAARDVCAIAADRFGWAPTTTKTYLALLVEKERLTTKRVGNSYLYRPKGTVISVLKQAADGLMEKALSGTEAPLLAYMIKNSELSQEDIAELRQVLEVESKKGGEE